MDPEDIFGGNKNFLNDESHDDGSHTPIDVEQNKKGITLAYLLQVFAAVIFMLVSIQIFKAQWNKLKEVINSNNENEITDVSHSEDE